MKDQIKELCFFMICGQTLLHFQSGKKYEKICRMILELLILVGIVGIILNFIQSLGFQKGEMTAEGNAVSNMQRNMEEALSRQLGDGMEDTDFLRDSPADQLMEQYTYQEMISEYNYIAQKYGLTMEEIKEDGGKLFVTVKKDQEEAPSETGEMDKIQDVKIGEIQIGEEEEKENGMMQDETASEQVTEVQTEEFRRELARAFLMDEENLEVMLIE